MTLQPLLHDLVPTLAAPTAALSGTDGQIRASGVQGLFHADARVLSTGVLRLDGREPEPIGHAPAGPGATRFVGLARWLGDRTPDPTVRVDRIRRVRPGGLDEEIIISSTASEPVTTEVTVETASDLAPIEVVKSGRAGGATWEREGIAVRIDGDLRRTITIAPGESTVLRWRLTVDDPAAVMRPGTGGAFSRPVVRARDHRLQRLVTQSLDDLTALKLTTTTDEGDTFLGAGVPWYLTLFGRDSLWAARMLLPLGTELAIGTLRALARRQGAKADPETGEAPGKIMHELRRADFALPEQGLRLPAVYYGTIDATPLWISLLHDAWRWGHAPADIVALLPHLEAALDWLAEHADPDGDGFLEYLDTTGRGLANQGWKDSGDAVRFHDGRIAQAPIALAEVQGYAYRAALDGAALLDAFGRPGGDRWRTYAARLADRFRASFWVRDGAYPALALDRDKRPVDALTSNIGHLLGTGLLNADEERRVAAALASEAMSGGYGLRTMSAGDRGFAPLSYHCGSIWAHDTAIVAAGLARAGFAAEAAKLIDGLLTAGEAFGFRIPELYGGDARTEMSRPVPYPASCHPQAWSAAAAVLILQAWMGLEPDVPGGRVLLRPMPDAPAVTGLRIAGHPVDFDGTTLHGLPDGLTIS
ncbi:glycogen debranching enzyme [Actinoplanes octamycinicus]|uniref:Glycogen debranching enzyme n=1 Tax=Actinoplanes octamycinicus TaxID=135948 RepID=A0A7W7H4H7_9ACTN|nr:glycogen debranching N-terminal domain-containing protein [Actinoplanes octamycinicus]MBB4743768.1 glycogen debranching enzyme [Actinoplanes octamycinicus]GIE58394.1 amylo-alpha-1,6-glucosidase [Actinoplanes octamycinicus]